MMIASPDRTAAFDATAFRAVLGQYATGVTIVTTQTPAGPMGITANSFASVSLDPPLVLWSPARASSRFAAFAAAESFSIHVLKADQRDLCHRFTRGGQGFDQLSYGFSPEGAPILADTLARFDCALHNTHDGGDHLIILGRVLRFAAHPGSPLIFAQGAYAALTAD